MNRKEFIKILSASGGSLLLFPCCTQSFSQWWSLTNNEANLVIAIAEQIIPADDIPGATDAGVVHFIDKQLAGFYSDHRDTYRDALYALQQYCLTSYNKAFEELQWEQQTEVLVMMEANKLSGSYWDETPSSNFFKLIKGHCMQGFYGSPRHGGNKNFVSYKMLKLDYPHVIGQNRYSTRCETLNVYEK